MLLSRFEYLVQDDDESALLQSLIDDLYDVSITGGTVSASVGDIKIIAHDTIPATWLACDGSEISRTTYAALFALVGENYGNGDGSTTFNLPDFRGRAAIGAGTGTGLTARALGDDIGAETHQLTISEMPSHNHASTISDPGNRNDNIAQGSLNDTANWSTNNRGGDMPHNNMQPSLVVQYIIKVQPDD